MGSGHDRDPTALSPGVHRALLEDSRLSYQPWAFPQLLLSARHSQASCWGWAAAEALPAKRARASRSSARQSNGLKTGEGFLRKPWEGLRKRKRA